MKKKIELSKLLSKFYLMGRKPVISIPVTQTDNTGLIAGDADKSQSGIDDQSLKVATDSSREIITFGQPTKRVEHPQTSRPIKFGRGSYVLISPCRDEAEFMEQTLESVIHQSVLPTKWIIVDDGSTDKTPLILSDYCKKYSWIEVVTRTDRGRRAVGPGVIDAFYAGYETINSSDYEFLCKFDLDLRLPRRYFEILIERMKASPHIATCSGKAYIEENGSLVNERHGDDMSLGMTKFYRVSCFEEIGGFVREVMWDGIDCHRCRMHGWIACSWDEPELRFIHLRPMGSSQQSIYAGRMRHGYGQYFMGTGFAFIVASAIFRINQKPYVIGSMAIVWGWLKSALQGKRRYQDVVFRKFLQRYQWRALYVGKKRAIDEIDLKNASHKIKGGGPTAIRT